MQVNTIPFNMNSQQYRATVKGNLSKSGESAEFDDENPEMESVDTVDYVPHSAQDKRDIKNSWAEIMTPTEKLRNTDVAPKGMDARGSLSFATHESSRADFSSENLKIDFDKFSDNEAKDSPKESVLNYVDFGLLFKTILKPFRGLMMLSKDMGVAVKTATKENVLNKEEKRVSAEEQKKNNEKRANKMAFISAFKEAAANNKAVKGENLSKLQERLGLVGMGMDQIAKLLGKGRNTSDREAINAYALHEAAKGVKQEQDKQEKQQKEQSLSAADQALKNFTDANMANERTGGGQHAFTAGG